MKAQAIHWFVLGPALLLSGTVFIFLALLVFPDQYYIRLVLHGLTIGCYLLGLVLFLRGPGVHGGELESALKRTARFRFGVVLLFSNLFTFVSGALFVLARTPNRQVPVARWLDQWVIPLLPLVGGLFFSIAAVIIYAKRQP